MMGKRDFSIHFFPYISQPYMEAQLLTLAALSSPSPATGPSLSAAAAVSFSRVGMTSLAMSKNSL